MKEEKAIDFEKLLDTSIWLSYLLDSLYQELIESKKTIFISPLSIFEIKKKLFNKKVPDNEIKEKVAFIKERTISISVDNNIAEKAAQLANENKMPAIDSLIYATSFVNNCILITRDNDFRNLRNVQVLD